MMLARVLQEGNQPKDFLQPLLNSGMKPFGPGHRMLGVRDLTEHHSTWGKRPQLWRDCGELLGCAGWGKESSLGDFLLQCETCSSLRPLGFITCF